MRKRIKNLNYSSKRVEGLKKQRLTRVILCWTCFVFTLLFLYFVFFTSAFLLINVDIKNTKEIPNEVFLNTVKQRILDNNNKIYWGLVLMFSRNPNVLANMLLIKDAEIESQLKIDFPQIQEIQISKNFFTHSLEVKVEERIPASVVLINGDSLNNIYLDQEGVLFKANTVNTTGLSVITLFDFSEDLKASLNNEIVERQIFLKEQMSYLMLLLNHLKESKILDSKLEYSFKKQNSINLKSANFDIYLTLNSKIIDAYTAANSYYSKVIKPKNKGIEYIDARYYPEKLFFK